MLLFNRETRASSVSHRVGWEDRCQYVCKRNRSRSWDALALRQEEGGNSWLWAEVKNKILGSHWPGQEIAHRVTPRKITNCCFYISFSVFSYWRDFQKINRAWSQAVNISRAQEQICLLTPWFKQILMNYCAGCSLFTFSPPIQNELFTILFSVWFNI